MMQAQTLPISVNSAGPAPAPSRGQSGNAAPDNTPFSQALTRQIEQRQQARDPAPAQQQQPAKAAQAQASRNESNGPAKAADSVAKQAVDSADANKADQPQAASAAARGEPAEADEAAAVAAESAAVAPVTDMLALVASLAQAAVAPATDGASAGELPAELNTDPAAATAAASAAAAAGAVFAATGMAQALPQRGAAELDTAAQAAPAALAGIAQDAAPAIGQAAIDVLAAAGLAPAATVPGAPVADTAAALAPAVKQDSASGDTAAQDHAPAAQKMFADALAQATQAKPGQQGSQGSQQGAGQQPEAVALATTERVADTAPAAPAQAQETSFVSQVQAARLEQVQANPLAAGDRLPARVGTPGWDKQLGQKIVWMVAGADQSATLTLNPPDLGPMQVVLNVTNDQATVNFTSAQPEVRQALENAMPKLREMMGESGITLGSATVNAGMPEQQQQAQRGNDARNGHGGGNGRGLNEGGGEGNAPAAPVRRAALPGQVDTFA